MNLKETFKFLIEQYSIDKELLKAFKMLSEDQLSHLKVTYLDMTKTPEEFDDLVLIPGYLPFYSTEEGQKMLKRQPKYYEVKRQQSEDVNKYIRKYFLREFGLEISWDVANRMETYLKDGPEIFCRLRHVLLERKFKKLFFD